MKKVWIALGGFCLIVAVGLFAIPAFAETNDTDHLEENLLSVKPFESLSNTKAPSITKPDWYNKRSITYSVSSNGSLAGNVAEFASQANATLNDSRGWSQLGVKFVQVESGGMFTLILAQASALPTYSSGCSADWSCAVGRNVIINDDRWMGATTSWNAAGGGLRDYRHMVVNHEVGHWLGHDHAYCGGAGTKAPVMQQQSMGLQGCSFNPWPLASEMWSSRI